MFLSYKHEVDLRKHTIIVAVIDNIKEFEPLRLDRPSGCGVRRGPT